MYDNIYENLQNFHERSIRVVSHQSVKAGGTHRDHILQFYKSLQYISFNTYTTSHISSTSYNTKIETSPYCKRMPKYVFGFYCKLPKKFPLFALKNYFSFSKLPMNYRCRCQNGRQKLPTEKSIPRPLRKWKKRTTKHLILNVVLFLTYI